MPSASRLLGSERRRPGRKGPSRSLYEVHLDQSSREDVLFETLHVQNAIYRLNFRLTQPGVDVLMSNEDLVRKLTVCGDTPLNNHTQLLFQ